MTDAHLQLYICIINFLYGLFLFILYFGVLIVQKNKSNKFIYFSDFISVILLGLLYITLLDRNKFNFHIYNTIFLTLGYITSYTLFNKKLQEYYTTFFIIIKYLTNKALIPFNWLISIPILKEAFKKYKVFIVRRKIIHGIKVINKQLK